MKKLILMAWLMFCAAAAVAAPWSGEMVASRCPEFDTVRIGDGEQDEVRECRVASSGRIGPVDGQEYRYALYCLVSRWAEPGVSCMGDSFSSRYAQNRAVAIFAGREAGEGFELIKGFADPEISMFVYAPPEIVESPSGMMLYVPIRLDGTGAGNASAYFLWQQGGWQEIESESWLDRVAPFIPEGLALRKGAWPELADLSVRIPLYRPEDANCCPEGGELLISLGIEGRRFVIRSARIEPR